MSDPKRIVVCHSGPTLEERQRAADELCEDCYHLWLRGEPFIGCDLCPPPRQDRAGAEAVSRWFVWAWLWMRYFVKREWRGAEQEQKP